MSTANEKEINSYSYGEKNIHPLYLFIIRTLFLQSTEQVFMIFFLKHFLLIPFTDISI